MPNRFPGKKGLTDGRPNIVKSPEDENLLKPGEDPGEGYEGSPDMYPDYKEDEKDAKEAGEDKAYMQSRGYNKGGSVSRGVGKAIRGTKFKGVF